MKSIHIYMLLVLLVTCGPSYAMERVQEESLESGIPMLAGLKRQHTDEEFNEAENDSMSTDESSVYKERAEKQVHKRRCLDTDATSTLYIASQSATSCPDPKKRFICDWPGCDQGFTQRGNLTVHKRVHTGEKPYQCDWPGCDKRFAHKSTLKDHKRVHTGEKPYQCDWPGCGKRFAKVCSLTVHKRIHTGEKPYVCDWPGCDKKFAQIGSIRKHKRMHTGEKPYVCDWPGCSKGFTTNSHLKKHKKTHQRALTQSDHPIVEQDLHAGEEASSLAGGIHTPVPRMPSPQSGNTPNRASLELLLSGASGDLPESCWTLGPVEQQELLLPAVSSSTPPSRKRPQGAQSYLGHAEAIGFDTFRQNNIGVDLQELDQLCDATAVLPDVPYTGGAFTLGLDYDGNESAVWADERERVCQQLLVEADFQERPHDVYEIVESDFQLRGNSDFLPLGANACDMVQETVAPTHYLNHDAVETFNLRPRSPEEFIDYLEPFPDLTSL